MATTTDQVTNATSAQGLDNQRSNWGIGQIGRIRYLMMAVAVLAQLATVLITWELWQVRVDPPNLPVYAAPEISFGIWIILSLLFMFLDPRRGFVVHALLIAVASCFDQFRMQPQFLATIFLMFAAVSGRGLVVCRWFLAGLWLWAGLHKILSPHWFAHASFSILQSLSIDEQTAVQLHWSFALGVGLGEILVGLSATFKPRMAAGFCVAMHTSIFLMLVMIQWNYSVLPWNMATAIVGAWIMMQVSSSRQDSNENRVSQAVWINVASAIIFLVAPVGFYYGVVDHGYANVLYSDYVPRGLITSKDSLREIDGWDPVHVPFPYETRTHRQFFELVAKPGDKLHIFDPRPNLNDQYFVAANGTSIAITEEQFFNARETEFAGIGFDDRSAMFWLRRYGKITQRRYAASSRDAEHLVSYAYTLDPERYSIDALKWLGGLPNLEQLQLRNCPVRDDDLIYISELKRLNGIGLSNTAVTDEGLKHLETLPRLRRIEIENTRISPTGLERLKKNLGL